MSDRFVKRDYGFKIEKSVDQAGMFEGYASTWNNEDTYGDTIAQGAFAEGLKALKDSGTTLKMLWSHDRYSPIGVFLDAYEDNHGLWVKGQLTLGVKQADETRLLMLAGAVQGMSIGAYVRQELYDQTTGTSQYLKLDLVEISPCVFPANQQATISVAKSATMQELEKCLRDVGGFSIKDAKAIIAKAKSFGPQRDVVDAIKAATAILRSEK